MDRFKAIMHKAAKSYDVDSIVDDLGASEDGFIDLRRISSFSGNVKSKKNVFAIEEPNLSRRGSRKMKPRLRNKMTI